MSSETTYIISRSIESFHHFQKKFKEKIIEIDGNKWRVIDTADYIHYQNNVPTLILLPGTQGAPSIFWNQINSLHKDIRIYSLGYPLLKNAFDLAESLIEFIKHEKIVNTSILGSSLGGYVAQIVATKYPECIDKLILANSMADARLLVSKRTPSSQIINFSDEELRNNIINRINSFPDKDAMHRVMKEILKTTILNLMTPDEIKSRFISLDNCGLLDKLEIPDNKIVLIDSEDDFVISEESRVELRNRHLNSKKYSFTNGGHFPYITKYSDYSSIIHMNCVIRHDVKPTITTPKL